MRLRNQERRLREGGIIALGMILSIALIFMVPDLLTAPMPLQISYPLSFFFGFILLCSVALAMEERSQTGGLLLAATYIPLFGVYVFQSQSIEVTSLIAGVIIGGATSVYALFKNRYDVLAGYVRLVSKLVVITLAVAIIVLMIQAVQAGQKVSPAPLGVGIAILITQAYLFQHSVRGIKASDVFIFGPSKSGKTLLLLALYNQFVSYFVGRKREVIIAQDEDSMRIENLLADLEGGHLPRSTRQDDLALYSLSGKKHGISPIEFTVIDYAGEYTADINETKYAEAIDQIAEAIEENPHVVERDIGSVEFLEKLKNDYSDDINTIQDAVILAYLYKKLQKAGKILFLVDGDHVMDFHENGRKDLTKLFGHYSRLMDLFGEDKTYGLVVTKTDKIKMLADIEDTSDDAEEIEQEIYDVLTQISTFQEIYNRALSVPVYFYTISADATMQPVNEANNEEKRSGILHQIYPWRVGEIVRFGF